MRKPTTPGEILRIEFLEPHGMTQRELAERIGCEVKKINRIVNGRIRVNAKTALQLERVFGSSANFWMNAQLAVDLYKIEKDLNGRNNN